MRTILFIGLAITGCAYQTKTLITSSAPASIELDGFQVCAKTPCEVEVSCTEHSHLFGFQSVSAVPKTKGQHVQSKNVILCHKKDEMRTINFEMNLVPVEQKADITIRNKK